MTKDKVRTITKRQKKAQLKVKKRLREKRRDLIPLRQAVFELSPTALQDFISILEAEDGFDDSSDETEDAEIELLELDADVDIYDEDEDLPGEYEGYHPIYTAFLGQKVAFKESATFIPSSKYTITTSEGAGNRFICRFEGPSFFYRRLPAKARQYVVKLRRFLETVAEWLEENKQAFLRNPSPESYVLGETEFLENPVVLHKGFLTRINSRLPAELQLDNSTFSRLLDNVWLLWPRWNMPLRHFFSSAFRKAWVIEGCMDAYKHNLQWQKTELVYKDFDTWALKSAKEKNIDILDPEQRLYVLCNRAGIKRKMANDILKVTITRIRKS